MFDNVKNPDDMFDGVETAPPPAAARDPRAPVPVVSMPTGEPTPVIEEVGGGFPWKPVVIALVVLLVIGAAGTISYFALSSADSPVPAAPVAQPEPTPTIPTPTTPTAPPVVTTPPAEQPPADRDRDGLSDVEEARLGTSPTSADTDGDGLFDKEEVDTYETDPLDPDTDGDTFQDGAEVGNGYNPNGSGKLFEIPE